jgi:hypothetical protein
MVATQRFFNINNKVLKYHAFINFGLNSMLAAGLVEASIHMGNGAVSFLMGLVGSSAIIANLGYTIIQQKEDKARSLVEKIALKQLNQKLYKTQEALLPYQHKALTPEQLATNEATKKFINGLFIMRSHEHRLFSWKREHKHAYNTYLSNGEHIFEQHKDILLAIYKKHLKEDLILVNCLLKSCQKPQEYLYDVFLTLWPAHNHSFNDIEMKYLERKLNDITFGGHCIITHKEVFSQLSLSLQEKVLVLAQEKQISPYIYKQLIEIHQKNDAFKDNTTLNDSIDRAMKESIIEQNKTDINSIEINSQSQEKLTSFEKMFAHVFENKESILKEIEELMLNKEKLSYILDDAKEKHYIETKLFLDNDVDRTLQSFHDEVKILHKMKLNHHPQFEELKEHTLNSISDRMSLINSKMFEASEQINASIVQELTDKINVSQTVLKAKM